MRLFVALDLHEEIRQRIARFVEGVGEFAPQPRWVSPQSLHITLKFIGQSEQKDELCKALEGISAPPVELAFRGTGFFPTAHSARVFWIGVEADQRLAVLASEIDAALKPAGVTPESRAFSPHLTLARAGSGAPHNRSSDTPNRQFARLQQKLAALSPPDFGTMTAREFWLYESKTAPSGAIYTKLARFELKST